MDMIRWVIFWLHGDSGPLIICTSFKFEHGSTTLMLCKMKMRLVLCLWHRAVGHCRTSSSGVFQTWFILLTELTYMLLRCLLLVAFSGGEWRGVITFLIVRSWMIHLWWTCIHVATLLVACDCLWGFWGVGGGAAITFLIVRSWWFIFHELKDMRVDTLCALRGTWVLDRVELLERSKSISCEHGAKASYVTLYRHVSMACPTRSCSAKHINMYGKRTMWTRTCSSCWPWNWKMEDEGNCFQKKMEMMRWTIPCKYHWKILKVCCGPSPHGISWQFSNYWCSRNTAKVEENHCTLLLKMLISSGASSPHVTHFLERWVTSP